jgi:hypothetical protein
MWNQKPREQRILEKIQSIKQRKRVIVRKPKKGLSRQDKQVKELLSILDGKDKATVKLEKVLKHLK